MMNKIALIFKLFYSFILNKKSAKLNIFTYIAIAGISLGVLALNITLSVIDGLQEKITEKIFTYNSHITITGFSNLNFDSSKALKLLNNNFSHNFTFVAPYAIKYCLFKHKKNFDGILVKGLQQDKLSYILQNSVVQGNISYKSSNDSLPVYISKTISEKYYIKLNDKITLISIKNNEIPTQENPPNIINFYVKGIFSTGIAEFDNNYFYTNLTDAQNLFGIPSNEINGIDLKVNNLNKLDSLTKSINKKAFYPLYARNIFDLFSNIFTWIDFQKKPIPIIIFFITVVAIFNVISTLIINIIIKTKNISILRFLGLSNIEISFIFILFGLFISFVGIILGNILSLTISILQIKYNLITIPASVYFINTVPISIKLSNYLIVSLNALLVTFLFSIIPVMIITKFKLIDILRFNES